MLIDRGVAVAIATDVNPGGGFSPSMPFAMTLACFGMGLTFEEALVGATINAAYSLDRHDRVGSLEVGKQMDAVHRRRAGDRSDSRRRARPIRAVVKKGRIVAIRRCRLLRSNRVRDVLAAFSSSDPTPGGGSASALASAVGASLLMMVAGLQKTRAGSDRRSRGARRPQRPHLTASGTQLTEADRRRHGGLRSCRGRVQAAQGERRRKGGAQSRRSNTRYGWPPTFRSASCASRRRRSTPRTRSHRMGTAPRRAMSASRSRCCRRVFAGARLNVDINLGGIADEAYKNSGGRPGSASGNVGTRGGATPSGAGDLQRDCVAELTDRTRR